MPRADASGDVRHKASFEEYRQEFALIERVQTHYNRLRRVEDLRLWVQKDYWSTPSELQTAGAGDCEDLATAKYFALRERGVPAECLRLVYTRMFDRARRLLQPHMVLWYRYGAVAAAILKSRLSSE